MYITLRKVRMTEDLNNKKVVAQLEGEDIVTVKISIEAESLRDIRDFLEDLSKGAAFELKITPIKNMNASLTQFFEELMEEA